MLISLAVIALNEESTLPQLFENIKEQTYPHDKMEIILVDSMSTDKTYEIMEKFKMETDFYKVKILKNPKKILPAGWNVVIATYEGDALIKVDAHATIPPDFIEKNVNLMKSGEHVTGGKRPNIIDENTPWKEMLLEAENSMFGSGIAPFRTTTGRKYVNSLFHAMYSREVIDKVGNFNEKLARTEDNEFNYRIRKEGYKLCYDDNIISYQHTRNSLPRMLKQKKANGMWIGLTTFVCRECLSIYHYVPFAFLMSLIASILLLPFTNILFYLVMGSYLVVNIGMSLISIFSKKFNPYNLLLPIIFFMLHISYGIGTLIGFIKGPSFLKKYREE